MKLHATNPWFELNLGQPPPSQALEAYLVLLWKSLWIVVRLINVQFIAILVSVCLSQSPASTLYSKLEPPGVTLHPRVR